MTTIILGAALSLGLNWPGHLSYDSVVQLAEGREGVYGGGHPPVMSWLLGIADRMKPGAALFVVFDTVLIAGALVSFVLAGARVSWLTPLIAGASAATPQLLIYPSIVWKDVLFAGSATAGFACVTHAALCWAAPARRIACLATALLLLALGALVRQNGAVLLPFAAAAVGWIAAASGSNGKGRGWAYGIAFLGVSALVVAGAATALNTRLEGPPSYAAQIQVLQTWDIVSAVTLEPHTDLTVLRSRARWLERLLRTDGVAAYSPIRADTMEPIIDRTVGHPESAALIAGQWEDIILRHPLLYLRVRAKAFELIFLTPNATDCVLVYTGVDGPPEEMRSVGLVRRGTERDRALANYALGFASSPVTSHAAYGGLGLVLLIGLLIRRRPPDIALAAMLASAITFALSFAVISISCDYRYLYALDLSVIAAALYASATWKADTVEPVQAVSSQLVSPLA